MDQPTATHRSDRRMCRSSSATGGAEDSPSVRAECWRYSRYSNGGEKLGDREKDPHEGYNLADQPGLEEVKRQLAGYARRGHL